MGFGPYRGGGGGMGNMQQLMKQAQKMQQDLQNAQEELKELEVTGSASNMVEVIVCTTKVLKLVHLLFYEERILQIRLVDNGVFGSMTILRVVVICCMLTQKRKMET